MRHAREYRIDTPDWIDTVMGVIGVLGGAAVALAPVLYVAFR